MPIKHYFIELKNRVFLIIISFIISILFSYSYKETLLYVYIKPSFIYTKMNKIVYFIYTDVSELFYTYLKIIQIISLPITSFFLLYQLIKFISPGLYKNEYNYIKRYVIIWLVLYFVFVIITYKYILTIIWNFFFFFENKITTEIQFFFEAKLINYFNFLNNIIYLCYLISLSILGILIIISKINNLKCFLKKQRKNLYFIIFIIITIIMPPDILNQIILSLTIIIVMETTFYINILSKNFIKVAN